MKKIVLMLGIALMAGYSTNAQVKRDKRSYDDRDTGMRQNNYRYPERNDTGIRRYDDNLRMDTASPGNMNRNMKGNGSMNNRNRTGRTNNR